MQTDVSQQLSQLYQDFSNRDLKALAQHFSKESKVINHNGKTVSGSRSLIGLYKSLDMQMDGQKQVQKGDQVVIEAGDVALVLTKTYAQGVSKTQDGFHKPIETIQVFRKDKDNQWKCLIDNHMGMALLSLV